MNPIIYQQANYFLSPIRLLPAIHLSTDSNVNYFLFNPIKAFDLKTLYKSCNGITAFMQNSIIGSEIHTTPAQ